MSDDAQALARRAALDLLARREHSLAELFDKVVERHPDLSPDDIVRPVLEQLAEANLQSDARFAEAFVRYRSTRGDGPLKIAASLRPRRIDSALLRRVLYDEGPDWVSLCRAALQRRFGVASPTTRAERARIERFLMQRGFASEQIRHALRHAEEE
jgi:regulatory protein